MSCHLIRSVICAHGAWQFMLWKYEVSKDDTVLKTSQACVKDACIQHSQVLQLRALYKNLHQGIKHLVGEFLNLQQAAEQQQPFSAQKCILQSIQSVQRQRLHQDQHENLPMWILQHECTISRLVCYRARVGQKALLARWQGANSSHCYIVSVLVTRLIGRPWQQTGQPHTCKGTWPNEHIELQTAKQSKHAGIQNT